MTVCDLCKGTGKLLKPWYDATGAMTGMTGDKCFMCDGKGTIGKPMTNEEYMRSCNTEQLVHVIHLMTTSCYVCGSDGVDYKRCYFHKKCTGPKEIEEWLKEPHDSFE